MKLLLTSLLLICISNYSFAGSCCAGGGGVTQLMLGDTKSILRVTHQDQSVMADVNSSREVNSRSEDELESIRTLNFSGSFRLSDLWQMGISAPLIEKTKVIDHEWKSLAGLGDVKLNIGYEFLPEFNRNATISQGFFYTEITLPTAPSIFDTTRKDLLDTRGSGHFIYGLGSVLKKRLSFGSFIFQSGVSYRPSRKFKKGLFKESMKTDSSVDNLIVLTQNFNLTKKVLASLTFSRIYSASKITASLSQNDTASLRNSLSMGIEYSSENSSYLVAYQDDFLVSNSYNSILGKSLSMSYVYRVNL